MSRPNASANAYLKTRVLTASPEELRLMLIDGAIRFATQGREGLIEKNFEKSFEGISNCRNIITELMLTMRDEIDPDLCAKVRSLYSYMFQQLVDASLERSTEKMDVVLDLLGYERETWVMLMDQLARERAGAPSTEPKPGPLSIQA